MSTKTTPCPRVQKGKKCLSGQQSHRTGTAAYQKCAAAAQSPSAGPKTSRPTPKLSQPAGNDLNLPPRTGTPSEDHQWLNMRDERLQASAPPHTIAAGGLKNAIGPKHEVKVHLNTQGDMRITVTKGSKTLQFTQTDVRTEEKPYRVEVGGRADTPYRPVKEIAKEMRGEIKKAKDVGWLPSNLKYSIKPGPGSSIRIHVDGWDKDDYKARGWKHGEDDPAELHSEAYKKLEGRLLDLGHQWNRHQVGATSGPSDYTLWVTFR